jgi:hypothetical protein
VTENIYAVAGATAAVVRADVDVAAHDAVASAAVGGRVAPALIYAALTSTLGPASLMRGWAIPCAADIASSATVARAIFPATHPAILVLLLRLWRWPCTGCAGPWTVAGAHAVHGCRRVVTLNLHD